MLIEEALYTMLTNSTEIAAIVGERIYPVTMPQFEKGTTQYPVLIYSLISRTREQTHDGPSPLVISHYDIDCLAIKYTEAKALAEAVRLALNGMGAEMEAIFGNDVKRISLENESDGYVFDDVEELALYHVPQEYWIYHNESLA